MRFRSMLALCAALAVALVPVSAFAQTHSHAAVQPRAPRAVVNGQEVGQAVIHQGRIYVPAGAFATAIGGTMTRDDAGTFWIKTPAALPTIKELTRLNPALASYQAISPYIPGMGVHLGVPGPALVLPSSKEGTLNGVEILVPAAQGWQPWFDQPENQPTEIEGLGAVYSQHIYLTQPEGLVEAGAGVPVILDGRYLSSGYELKGHLRADTLYIPLRSAVDLLGGTVAWDQAAMTATAAVTSRGISFDWLKQLNPSVAKYQQLSEFVPNMGFHHGAPGPHVTVMTDRAGTVVGFELLMPAAAGWHPWFDQPENQPMELEGLGQVYTQHLYLVDPASIR